MVSEIKRGNNNLNAPQLPSPQTTESRLKNWLTPRTLKWGTGLLLTYFGLRLLFLALNISSFVPPDEVTHAGICKVFARTLFFPENAPDTYEFGLVTTTPWLYYWSMGKLLHLNLFGLSDLVFLRLLNIPLAFGTIYFTRRSLRLLSDSLLTQLLLTTVLTNCAMFTLLSASVSYDNLTNLWAAMSFYYLFASFKGRSGELLAVSICCQLAGCLTKITFLPLVAAMALLLLIQGKKLSDLFPSSLTQHIKTMPLRNWLLTGAILSLFGLNINLYGRNYLSYGELLPSMQQVLSPQTAMQYRLAARGLIFNQYREEKISYMDALLLAGEITHPGDKSDTFFLLMNYEKLKRNPQLWMGPFTYAKTWLETTYATIFGIKAHLPLYKDSRLLIPYYILSLMALLGFILNGRPRKSGWLPAGLAAVAIPYAGYLMYAINYTNYLNYGVPGITLQGRYLFPLLVPLSVLLCRYLLLLFRTEAQRVTIALVTILFFIAGDFPWFLLNTTTQWYNWMPH